LPTSWWSLAKPKVAGIFGGCHDRVRARLLGVLEVLVPGDAMVAARDTMADMTLMFSLGILQHDLIRGRTKPTISPVLHSLRCARESWRCATSMWATAMNGWKGRTLLGLQRSAG
jgi:hypothetical protein